MDNATGQSASSAPQCQQELASQESDTDRGARELSVRRVGNTDHVGAVYNVRHAENNNFGTNYGTIIFNGGSSSRQPPIVESQNVPTAELDRLLVPIRDASYTRNRKTAPPDSDCLPGTRTKIIRKLTAWVNTSIMLSNVHIFWLHGYVGCGKSAISQALSQKYGQKGRLLASFFFYRNAGDRSKMSRFAVTLASQMIAAIPATEPFVKSAVKAEPGLLISEVSLAAKLERLVYKPFNAVVKRGLVFRTLLQGPFLIVIDGLDECEDKEEVKEFIEHLLDFFKRHPLTPLRFFITSRVEQHIQECLNTDGVKLDDLVAHGSDEDLQIFLKISFAHRARLDPVIAAYTRKNEPWPTEENRDMLVRHIGGSFVFASALFKYIVEPSDDGLTPMNRLLLTLNMNPGLDGLYAFSLARSQLFPHFSDVVSTIALIFQPLSITAIAELLGIQTFEVLQILVNLQAVIHIPGTDELPVTLCHTSLRDFLTTESRSGPFFTPPSYHLHLAYRCSIVVDAQDDGSAAASYGIHSGDEHFKRFARLPFDSQSSSPRCIQTIDALFTRILAKSQHLPHFSDVLWAIALLYEPLPISGMAELLAIEQEEVSTVLVSLGAVVHVPSNKSDVVSFGHSTLHDFLSTKARSGRFFAPLSYHRHLFYCCLDLRDKQHPDSAATAYSIAHQAKHFGFFSSQEQRRFTDSSSLDAFYIRLLRKAQHLPHFLDIISTITSLLEPIPIGGIAELLAIEPSEIAHVLVNLQAIVYTPETDDLPTTLLHASLRNFLTSVDRSGRFFISPSFHLKLSFYCYRIDLKHQQSGASSSSSLEYSRRNCLEHFWKYLNAYSDSQTHRILKGFDRLLPHSPEQALSYYRFSFTHISLWLFGSYGIKGFSNAVMGCLEFLALALECDRYPDKWLEEQLSGPGYLEEPLTFEIQQEQAEVLQQLVKRVEASIRAKCPLILSRNPRRPDNASYSVSEGARTTTDTFPNWIHGQFICFRTPIDAYRFFEWISGRVQAVTDLGEPSTDRPYSFSFGLDSWQLGNRWSSLSVKLKLRD